MTWGEVVRSYLDVLLATGFFHSEVWSSSGLIVSCLLRIVHFSRHQVQWMRRRHQLVQTMQALMQGCLALSCRVRKWGYLFQESSQAMRARDTVMGQTGPEGALANL